MTTTDPDIVDKLLLLLRQWSNRSPPREALGDDPREQLVRIVRRRLWVELRRSRAIGSALIWHSA
jgi:hypothetical protein